MVEVYKKLTQSGWDLTEELAKAWLTAKDDTAAARTIVTQLVTAIEQANRECGSCGCEFDPLYKRARALKDLLAG